MTNLDSIIKSRDITLPTKVCIVKAMAFPVIMYGCENWTKKKAEHWRIDAFELWCWRRLESPLDCKEIKSVHPKGNQFWIFIGRTDAEAEAPILWLLDMENWLIGKDWCWRKTEGKRRGWQRTRWLDGITNSMDEFEQALGDSEKQGSLAFCSPWGHSVGHDWATEEQYLCLLCVKHVLSALHMLILYFLKNIFFVLWPCGTCSMWHGSLTRYWNPDLCSKST